MRLLSPPIWSPTSMASWRTTTSSFRSSAFSPDQSPLVLAGRFRSSTEMRVKTAVDRRNGTSTTIRLMNALISSCAGCLRRRRCRISSCLVFGREPLNQVQEADLRGLEAVDDVGGARLQERVHEQERDGHGQRERGVVHRDRDGG